MFSAWKAAVVWCPSDDHAVRR